MTFTFRRIFQIDKSRLTLAGIMAFFVASSFIWVKQKHPKIQSPNDLYFIKGHFRNYFFDKGLKFTVYTFTLQEFSNSFKIKADFLGGFDKNNFTNLRHGDDLTISIAPTDIAKLNTNDSYFFVFSIADKQRTFLSTDYTIKENNSKFSYYAAASFFFIGIVCLYYGLQWEFTRRRVRRKNTEKIE